MLTFNINDYARVRLTPEGMDYLRQHYPSLHATVGSDGYYREQLWGFMELFAKRYSGPLPFEPDILLETNERPVHVRRLDWRDGGMRASGVTGSQYIIDPHPDSGNAKLFVARHVVEWSDRLGLFDTLDEAQAACQKHFSDYVATLLEKHHE